MLEQMKKPKVHMVFHTDRICQFQFELPNREISSDPIVDLATF